MPRKRHDEDLFKNSTMTFGEHLEELRKCLFKAVLGLVAGLFVGFFAGGTVVDYIQTPLRAALRSHVVEGAIIKLDQQIEETREQGHSLEWNAEQAKNLVEQRGFLPELVYVRLRDFMPQAENPGGRNSEGTATKAPPAGGEAGQDAAEALNADLVPRLMWHHVEDDRRVRATALNAQEGFMIWLKASLLVGAVLSSPWIFYQLWSFVAAGLYPHERRYVNIYLPFSVGLFIFGAAVAFYGAFPLVLRFLFSFNTSLGIEIDPRISEWLSFALFLPLGFGIAFQLPLVMLFLQRVGIFTVQAYLSYWRVAVLVIFVIAAILTPPDPGSMTLLALPLTMLYFGGILLCKWMPRGRSLLDPVED